MNGDGDINQRVIDLEGRLAQQEKTLEELSDTLHRQWSQSDKLKETVTLLLERFRGLEEHLRSLQPGDKPPPHY